MKARVLSVAQAEIEAAIDFYNRDCPGLGYEFADEVFRTIRRSADNPLAWQSISQRTRRCLTHRFPYAVLYQIRGDELLVIAVMHLHRHPDSWKNRV